MKKLGEYLRNCRKNNKLSLKDVARETGITDSRLSKIENETLNCPASDLRCLAKLYNESAISLFIIAGYLDQDDVKKYQLVFKGVENLSESDREHIQDEINYLLRKEGKL